MTQPPHDKPTASSPEELREQVEQTRHQLGETVEALAGKADVKARAQEKATALKEQTAEAAQRLQEKLPDSVKDKAAAAAVQVKAQAGQAERIWQDKAPEQVRDKRKVMLAGAAAAVVAWVLLRRRK